MGAAQQRPATTELEGEKILELAKNAENLYKSHDPAEQRRLLETVLSNCTFDAGTICVTYASPFDLLVKGNETGDRLGGRDSNSEQGLFLTW
jgi:site-specific DNA recombinase